MSREEQAAERKRAATDLEDIERLKKYAPFQRYFVRRIIAERDKLKEKILKGRSAVSTELHDALVAYDTYDNIAKMIVQDEAGCRNVLVSSEPEKEGDED